MESRHVWLSYLRSLGDDYAPELPYRVSVDSLSATRLRQIVIKAVRKHDLWTSKRLAEHVREVSLSTLIRPVDALGGKTKIGCFANFSPMRAFLPVLWMPTEAGQNFFFQCWHVASHSLALQYPPSDSQDGSPTDDRIASLFAFDSTSITDDEGTEVAIKVALISLRVSGNDASRTYRYDYI